MPDSSDPSELLLRYKSMNTDEKLESIFLCLQDVKTTNQKFLHAEQTVREIRDNTHENTRRINLVAYKSIDSEARQRRNNRLFWGIPEDPFNASAELLADKMSLDPDAICLQRAHRLGTLRQPRRRGPGGYVVIRHLPIVACFCDFYDFESFFLTLVDYKGQLTMLIETTHRKLLARFY